MGKNWFHPLHQGVRMPDPSNTITLLDQAIKAVSDRPAWAMDAEEGPEPIQIGART